eukprot:gnl/MRDRNA2_/MRDRNA2_87615_c0_seq1.p1 gnl/MRDRNA2_/MRDRNA2_87615_c0~~gnl/MRDRNA2_/MRDRNA2_87615_c0_seq1.p1  ORF type:complete len:163 (+),score=46.78 gnl/MRDRNA2_/MRDRNA2_87615_c0_seq1:82-570(+)
MQIILNDKKEISAKQHDNLKRGFRLTDSRRCGKLQKQEATLLFRAAGQSPTEEELDHMFKGEPSAEQFENIFKANYKPPIEDQGDIEDLLKVFDLGGNGLVSKQQFIDVMANMGEKVNEKDLERIFEQMDVDANGMVMSRQIAKFLLLPQGCVKLPPPAATQ